MKELICIALVAILFFSCSKEQDSVNNIDQDFSKEFTVLEISKDQKMLSFESKDDMHKTISELMLMDDAKRAEWYKLQGDFESQESFQWKVIDELTEAKTVEEVRSIQKKYSNFFIWNNNIADEDMNPYIPSGEYGYSYVCNRNGEVLIAGEVCNFNNAKTLEETRQYKWFDSFRQHINTRVAINEWRNHLFVSNESSRRFWMKTGITHNGGYPAIDFYAEKKVLLFWIQYRTAYSLKYVSHTSNWNTNSDFFGPIWRARPNFHDTGEMTPHTPITIGYQPTNASMVITGRSRGTGTLEGTLVIGEPFQWIN